LLLTSSVFGQSKTQATAVFSGGCFWGVEAVFERLKGVTDVVSGYTGGSGKNPTYEQVSSGTTGQAESVKVTYDPQVVNYETLLKVFFLVAHDPTQLNYQGPDHGTQYRSALWYETPAQRAAAETYLKQLTTDKAYRDKVVTEVKPAETFWPAEDYHQDFIKNNPTWPYVVRFDLPKLRFLHANYASLEKS
jgi:peptide-methionine (S)-S-oxide reductase